MIKNVDQYWVESYVGRMLKELGFFVRERDRMVLEACFGLAEKRGARDGFVDVYTVVETMKMFGFKEEETRKIIKDAIDSGQLGSGVDHSDRQMTFHQVRLLHY